MKRKPLAISRGFSGSILYTREKGALSEPLFKSSVGLYDFADCKSKLYPRRFARIAPKSRRLMLASPICDLRDIGAKARDIAFNE